jgi:hypothetical protein
MQPSKLLTALLVSKRYQDSSLLINPIRFSIKKTKTKTTRRCHVDAKMKLTLVGNADQHNVHVQRCSRTKSNLFKKANCTKSRKERQIGHPTPLSFYFGL